MRCAAEEDSSSSTYRRLQGQEGVNGLGAAQEGSSGSTFGRAQGSNCALPR